MGKPRFYVDWRVGCVAVRDSLKDSPDNPGLHEDTEGVVKFWMGKQAVEDVCPTCGSTLSRAWAVGEEVVAEAEKLCRELNEKEEKK
jgi:hypothetical protein